MVPRQIPKASNLTRLLRETALQYPEKVALICRDRSVTYQQLDRTANGLAHWFLNSGLSPGDRIAIHWTNSIEAVELMMGCFFAGMIAVPINTRLKAPEIGYMLQQTKPKLCYSQPDLATAIENARESLPGLAPIHTQLPDAKFERDLPLIQADSPALILFTSGSTARPKGATHTHATLTASAATMWPTGIDHSATVLVAAPLMHGSGLVALTLPALASGATAVLIPTFDPAAVLNAVANHRCTLGLGLPAMMQFLVAEQEQRPRTISSLRSWLGGGDSVPVSLQERFRKLFGIPLLEGYAMTESITISWNRPDRIRPGSLGQPALDVEVEVRGADGKCLNLGEVGELVVRSPANFRGYWNDPAATSSALEGGKLRTGDLVSLDKEGYLWFQGRCKSVIIRGGSNISPQEVEEALYHHPAVMEAGVVGIRDEVYGERVVACVALRRGQNADEETLRCYAREHLADYKVPERILFLPCLPKGSTGKIQREVLKGIVVASLKGSS